MNCSTPGFPVLQHLLDCSNSCPLSQWCYPTISSSVIPISSCLQFFPSIRVFSSELALCIRWSNIGALLSASVLPMNIQGWFPLGLTESKGLSKVFSSITVWKHQFFGTQPSLWSNSHIHTWLLANHSFDYIDLCWQSDVSADQFMLDELLNKDGRMGAPWRLGFLSLFFVCIFSIYKNAQRMVDTQ